MSTTVLQNITTFTAAVVSKPGSFDMGSAGPSPERQSTATMPGPPMWPRITEAMQTEFTDEEKKHLGEDLWCLHTVQVSTAGLTRSESSAALAFRLATGIDLPKKHKKSLATVRRAAHCRGYAVDVVSWTRNTQVVKPDVHAAPDSKRVVLRLIRKDHYHLGVAIKDDNVQQLYPLRRIGSRYIRVEGKPLELPPGENASDLKQYFLGEGVLPDRAEAWKSWQTFSGEMIASKSENPGISPIFSIDATSDEEEVDGFDFRAKHLAAWASFHRTSLRLYYSQGFILNIAPEFYAEAHESAKLGRIRHIELGRDCIRNYYMSHVTKRGSQAVSYVYSPNFHH